MDPNDPGQGLFDKANALVDAGTFTREAWEQLMAAVRALDVPHAGLVMYENAAVQMGVDAGFVELGEDEDEAEP